MGTVADVAAEKLEEARWAVVVNALEDAALLRAIWPLVEHRMRQMGGSPPAVDWREGERATAWLARHSDNFDRTLKSHWGQIPPVLIYRPGERPSAWLARHGVTQGPVDPGRGVPFYLLLLGRPGPLSPDDEAFISLAFQDELDIFWGVGRLCFTDGEGRHRLEDYTAYAERLVQFEQRQDAADQLRREIVYFATRHPGDMATIRSLEQLVRPLIAWGASPESTPARQGFAQQPLIEQDATRAGFERTLRGGADGKPPALLFVAAHGIAFPPGHPLQVQHQGALLMQDWPGAGPVRREQYVAGDDLVDARLDGMLAVLCATYGLASPARDELIFDEQQGYRQIAPFSFVARLPQQLLLSGALGVIGHIDRAWAYSLDGVEGASPPSQPFEDVLGRLMRGRRVGDASDQFNVVQGARGMALIEEIESIKFGKTVEPRALARLLMARNDARGYALLGDPAARLP